MNVFTCRAARAALVPPAVAPCLLLAIAAALPLPVAAQAQPANFIALGAISVPEFEGSSDKSVGPLLAGRIDLGAYGSLRIAGLTLQHNLMGERSAWALGPLVSVRPKRDAGVEDEVVRTLREVEGTGEFGVFVEYGFRDALAAGDRLGLGVEAKGGKGSQFSLTASYMAARQGAFQFGADLRAVYANDRYMDSYFSIDADNSVRSGLPVYTATSGAKNVSLGLTGTYDINSDWLILGRIGVSRLLGDARDSPIVTLRGDASAATVGLAVGYRF